MNPSDLPCGCREHISPAVAYRSQVVTDSTQTLHAEQTIKPTHGLSVTPYEFVIDSQEDSFVCLNNLTMTAKFKILNENDTQLGSRDDDDEAVTPVNNVLNSLWKKIDVRINDLEVSPTAALHMPYKAMLSQLLSYNNTALDQLSAAGFSKEPSGDNMKLHTNTAAVARTALFAKSASATFTGHIPLDICSMDNHLAPRTKLSLHFHPSDPEFFLHANSTDKYRVKIEELLLHFRRVKLPPSFTEKLLSSPHPSRYQMPHTELKVLEVPQGVLQWKLPLYPRGHVLPKQIVVAMQHSNSVSASTNPYYFTHHSVSYLAPTIDGVVAPNTAITPDFANKLVSREYYRLTSETGKRNLVNAGTLISLADFEAGGYCLFPFDLTPDKCNGRHAHLGKKAKLDLELRFGTTTWSNINVLILAVFDQVLLVDKASGAVTTSIF